MQPKIVLHLHGQLLREESRLAHRKQLGRTCLGRLVREELHLALATARLNVFPTWPPDGEEILGARCAFDTIENTRDDITLVKLMVKQPQSLLQSQRSRGALTRASRRSDGCATADARHV